MDGIAKLLVLGGAVGLAGAGLWWHETYSRIGEFLGAPDLPTECLWTMGGACGAVSSAANMIGANAYDPRLFWGSAACLVVGAILLVIPSGGGRDDVYLTRKRDRDYRPPEPDDRRDPYL